MSEITQNSTPDAEGNIIPPSIHEGSAKITGSHADNESILIALDAGIYNVRKATCGGSCQNCDGYNDWEAELNPFGVAVNGQYTVALSAAYDGGSRYNFAATWSSSNTSVMTVGSGSGTTTGIAPGSATIGGPVTNLQSAPVYAPQCNPYGSCPVGYGGGGSSDGTVDGIPDSETTAWVGTVGITEGVFQMTLQPGTYSYDNHYVEENSPAPGTNTCWWPGTNPSAQYPMVTGSTWTVGQGGNGHNQYGGDGIGYTSAAVNEIQQDGPAHGIDFPCTLTWYQEMTYEGDANTFYNYTNNVLTQTIGSNSASGVKVCRAGVCTNTIPF